MHTPRRPSHDALAIFGAVLGGGSPALGFASAVLLQTTRPPGSPPDPAAERTAADRIARILALREPIAAPDPSAPPFRPGQPDQPDQPNQPDQPVPSGSSPAAMLAADPVLLAAFFQNVDLLYAAGDPAADRVSGWIMDALALAQARPGP